MWRSYEKKTDYHKKEIMQDNFVVSWVCGSKCDKTIKETELNTKLFFYCQLNTKPSKTFPKLTQTAATN